jgi:hypothetical protein
MNSLLKALCWSICWVVGSSMLLSSMERWNKTADMRKCGWRKPPLLVQWLMLTVYLLSRIFSVRYRQSESVNVIWKLPTSQLVVEAVLLTITCHRNFHCSSRCLAVFIRGRWCTDGEIVRLKWEFEIWLSISVLYAIFVWMSYSSRSCPCLHVLWFVCPIDVHVKVFWSQNSKPWNHQNGSKWPVLRSWRLYL